MIAIIDYGMGNLRSVQKALEKSGSDARITHDPEAITNADKIVLPGVGAMQPAMQRLNELGLIPAILRAVESDRPFLGICLGYQLLFEISREGGDVSGLGLLQGTVERFQNLKIPHMGWNRLDIKNQTCPLFAGIENGPFVYFCHSYYVQPADPQITAATTNYGLDFAAAVWRRNLFAVQFHPEKSQKTGLKMMENFTRFEA